MSSPTITYVQLVNGDPVWDLSAQFTDLYAVAQAISTRLKLFLGEFWAAKNDGTPVFQSILGQAARAQAQQQIASILAARITGAPYVIGINNIQVGFVKQTRAFTYFAVVNTQFGQLVVTNIPQPPSGALP